MLFSLWLFVGTRFYDTIEGTNPFRHLTMIDIVEPAPVALSKTEWNAVRRCAEAVARRDHGLALALATLFRYAGLRVSEVAALQIPDVQISARRGLLIIRRGKGLKHREIPLVYADHLIARHTHHVWRCGSRGVCAYHPYYHWLRSHHCSCTDRLLPAACILLLVGCHFLWSEHVWYRSLCAFKVEVAVCGRA